MTRLINRLRQGLGPAEPVVQDSRRPLYARALRLRHLAPGKALCAVYFEGSIVLAMLLAFVDLVSWYGVLALPGTVAAMVKFNDLVAGRLPHPPTTRRASRVREAGDPAPATSQPSEWVASFDQSVAGGAPTAAPPEAAPAGAAHSPDAAEPDDEENTAVIGVIPVKPSPFQEAKTTRLKALPEPDAAP